MAGRDYLIALSTFIQFGPARTKLLLKYFKSAKNIWIAGKKQLLETGLKETIVNKFIEHRDKFDFEEYFKSLAKSSVLPLTIDEKEYPENLKNISDAPYVLYTKGVLKKSDSRAVAVVGSRMMTTYGREIATKFAGELASYGITIISGLALGIDAQAQRAALLAGGRTISVLASGLDIISPLSNKSLAMEFIKEQGAVVSEYPLSHTPFPADFPVRDRLIAGLSKAVIVIEGRMKSGTFYTVNAALEQGKPVFAVPGPVNSPASEGPNYLIQNGARLITNVKDVLDELQLQFKVDPEEVQKNFPDSPQESILLNILETEPLHFDELVRISGVATSEVSARLTIMEMKGMVRNLGNGMYRKL